VSLQPPHVVIKCGRVECTGISCWHALRPCQYAPGPKNMLPTWISLNDVVVLLLWLCFVLLSHHWQHFNLARPRAWLSEDAGTPADRHPCIPWCTPSASMMLVCGEF